MSQGLGLVLGLGKRAETGATDADGAARGKICDVGFLS